MSHGADVNFLPSQIKGETRNRRGSNGPRATTHFEINPSEILKIGKHV
jgi:hypothetical protein